MLRTILGVISKCQYSSGDGTDRRCECQSLGPQNRPEDGSPWEIEPCCTTKQWNGTNQLGNGHVLHVSFVLLEAMQAETSTL